MEEKLNELLEIAEIKIIRYEKEIEELKHKLRFLRNHSFNKEAEYVELKLDSITLIFYDYRDSVVDIRNLLKTWQS
jgi:hypothetical protein